VRKAAGRQTHAGMHAALRLAHARTHAHTHTHTHTHRPRHRQQRISSATPRRRAMRAQACSATLSASSQTSSSSSSSSSSSNHSSSKAKACLVAAQRHRKAASFHRTSPQTKVRICLAVAARRASTSSGSSRRAKPPAPWRLRALPLRPAIICLEARKTRCKWARAMAATSLVARPSRLATPCLSFPPRPLPGECRRQGPVAACLATRAEIHLPAILCLAAGALSLAAWVAMQELVDRREE